MAKVRLAKALLHCIPLVSYNVRYPLASTGRVPGLLETLLYLFRRSACPPAPASPGLQAPRTWHCLGLLPLKFDKAEGNLSSLRHSAPDCVMLETQG